MGLVLIWITSIIVTCVIASKNERNVGAWFLASVFMGFLATIIVLAMGPVNPPQVMVVNAPQPMVPQDNRAPCPRCGESIVTTAKVCRFCQVELTIDSWSS